MVCGLTAKKKGISTNEFGGEIGVKQKTAWLFKVKVQVVMIQHDDNKLDVSIDTDEILLRAATLKFTENKVSNKRIQF